MNVYSLTREYALQEPATEFKTLCGWQQEFKSSVTNIEELCQILELKVDQLPINLTSQQSFKLRAPKSYLQRIQKSNPNDPLLLQILPTIYEQQKVSGFIKDPVGDLQSVKSTGLLQKYKGRALLLATSLCAIHCRYCFRRYFPYSVQNPRHDSWQQALQELEYDSSIHEVILSGGDPLVLSDSELSELIKKISSIQHIKRVRIHTRLPVVIPSRICDELLDWIKTSPTKIIIVLHINHPQEINQELHDRLQQLTDINCTLLNQSVLLRNINDEPSTLVALSEALFGSGVLPYYLHLLDKVEGAAYFDVPKTQACKLMQVVAKHLPGYLVPKLVEELPGRHAKSLICY